jgi:hypothetical protein
MLKQLSTGNEVRFQQSPPVGTQLHLPQTFADYLPDFRDIVSIAVTDNYLRLFAICHFQPLTT